MFCSTCTAELPLDGHEQIPSGLIYNLPLSLHFISDLHLRSSAQHAGDFTELPPAKPQLSAAHDLEISWLTEQIPSRRHLNLDQDQGGEESTDKYLNVYFWGVVLTHASLSPEDSSGSYSASGHCPCAPPLPKP